MKGEATEESCVGQDEFAQLWAIKHRSHGNPLPRPDSASERRLLELLIHISGY